MLRAKAKAQCALMKNRLNLVPVHRCFGCNPLTLTSKMFNNNVKVAVRARIFNTIEDSYRVCAL
jgi:hypothetical protein